jgi:hypothetical protein
MVTSQGRAAIDRSAPLSPLRVTSDRPSTSAPLRAAVTAVVLALGLGGSARSIAADTSTHAGATISATSDESTAASASASYHPSESCACGMRCVGRCCCAPEAGPDRQSPVSLALPDPAATPGAPVDAPSGPCLGAAPCGGGTSSPASRPVISQPFEPAAIAGNTPSMLEPAGDRLPLGSRPSFPLGVAAPLDRPPKLVAG